MSAPAPRSLADVKGWFLPADQRLFTHFLTSTVVPAGDLVEIGAYLGKSAILMGRHLRDGERFTVCDLFGDDAEDPDNRRENRRSYRSLTRDRFEANYLAFHPELPEVVQAPSSTILDHVPAGTARFVHVDGSHLYEHVAGDVRSARVMAVPGAVIAFDDYRSPHTPGTALAVWEAVLEQGMEVIALTPRKLYATFGDATAHREELLSRPDRLEGLRTEMVDLRGRPAIRVWQPRTQAGADRPRPDEGAVRPAAPLARVRRRLRRS
ncbi:class I SAM-dependent methyltransferase [Nocardioides sp. SYSU DS0651]|uniref:class I SAM-dependent methyltransferase n=1 Tax=Nocardioides sp. SYSU DS0651 TaxID=3415955 RepID=UPI003F4C910E